jgi:superfamily II DNA or RNA helicase
LKLLPEAGNIGVYYGKRHIDGSGKVYVATVQTLLANTRLIDYMAEVAGTVIVDEAHHTPCSTFEEVVNQFKSAYYFGLTATPSRPDGMQVLMTASLGPIVHQVDRKQLYDSGALVIPKLDVVVTDFEFSTASSMSSHGAVNAGGDEYGYHELLSALYEDDDRVSKITTKIMEYAKEDYLQLVVGDNIAYLTKLLDSCTKAGLTEATLLNSKVGSKNRESIITRFKSGELRVVFATQLAREGLDIPELNVIHLVSPRKGMKKSIVETGAIALEQEIGRVMRPHPIYGCSKPAFIVDYCDYRNGIFKSQYYTRNTLYKELQIQTVRLKVESKLNDFPNDILGLQKSVKIS